MLPALPIGGNAPPSRCGISIISPRASRSRRFSQPLSPISPLSLPLLQSAFKGLQALDEFLLLAPSEGGAHGPYVGVYGPRWVSSLTPSPNEPQSLRPCRDTLSLHDVSEGP
jgi:hypothetical protein